VAVAVTFTVAVAEILIVIMDYVQQFLAAYNMMKNGCGKVSWFTSGVTCVCICGRRVQGPICAIK
jgi:hypothetical protein